MKTIMDAGAIDRVLEGMARQIADAHFRTARLLLIGIQTRGVYLARRLREKMKAMTRLPVDVGSMDITLYRDDWTRIGDRPVVAATDLLFSVDGRELVIVDDVLFTGRTARAALDAVMDFGRPTRIELAVLVDRGHRELPIQPDFTGLVVETAPDETVNVLLTEHDATDRVIVQAPPA